MEFKTIQDKNTLDIKMYFVDNKRVKRNKFIHLETLQFLRGCKYNSNLTSRTKNNNFKHTANL